eukprot:gene29899-36104_t
MVDDVVSDSQGEEEEESDSDNSSVGGKNNSKNAKSNKVQAKSRAALAKAKAKAAKAKAMKIRPLATPDYVKAIGYLRCNCKEGVPMDCLKYEPVPQMVMVDIIQVQTYVEIMDPAEKTRYWSQIASKRTETAKSKKKLEETNSVANNLPRILSYLHYGQCWAAACVSRGWNIGANMYKEYVDIRNFVPYQIYRPHISSVSALLLGHTIIYSAGDYRISATELYTGEHCSVVARDSGGFQRMLEYEENLYCCSTNGSIRAYGLTHTGRNLALVNTMWEHSKSVQDYICAIPSDGPCPSHGITDHVCYFFSCSEDRSAKVWSTSKQQCIRTISSDALRAATFTRLAVSNRHIFVGTTAASIAVFSAHAICERDDVHLCNVANHDPTYCLQITLKLPKNLLVSGNLPWITGLLCPKIGPEFPNLWAADASGQLTIWYVPREGLEFTPAYTVKAHYSAINDLQKTWRHVISIGDDGLVVLHDIIGFYRKVRKISGEPQAAIQAPLSPSAPSAVPSPVHQQRDAHRHSGSLATVPSEHSISVNTSQHSNNIPLAMVVAAEDSAGNMAPYYPLHPAG